MAVSSSHAPDDHERDHENEYADGGRPYAGAAIGNHNRARGGGQIESGVVEVVAELASVAARDRLEPAAADAPVAPCVFTPCIEPAVVTEKTLAPRGEDVEHALLIVE